MSKIRLPALVALGLMASVAVGCGDDDAPFTSSTPKPGLTFGSGIPTMTYTDPDYGYSFEYPASWFLSPQHDVSHHVNLDSYDPARARARSGIPRDKLRVIFWVADGVDKPIADWLTDGRNNPGQPPPPTDITDTDTTLGGRDGIFEVVQMNDGEDSALHKSYYIAMWQSRLFVVNAVPGDSYLWPQLEPVLGSVRFADGSVTSRV